MAARGIFGGSKYLSFLEVSIFIGLDHEPHLSRWFAWSPRNNFKKTEK